MLELRPEQIQRLTHYVDSMLDTLSQLREQKTVETTDGDTEMPDNIEMPDDTKMADDSEMGDNTEMRDDTEMVDDTELADITKLAGLLLPDAGEIISIESRAS